MLKGDFTLKSETIRCAACTREYDFNKDIKLFWVTKKDNGLRQFKAHCPNCSHTLIFNEESASGSK